MADHLCSARLYSGISFLRSFQPWCVIGTLRDNIEGSRIPVVVAIRGLFDSISSNNRRTVSQDLHLGSSQSVLVFVCLRFSARFGCLLCFCYSPDLPPVSDLAFPRLGATIALIVILRQINFLGIRVGEESNPGPTMSISVPVSDGVTTPLPQPLDQDLEISVPGVVSRSPGSLSVAAPSLSLSHQLLLLVFLYPLTFSLHLFVLLASVPLARTAPHRSRSPPPASTVCFRSVIVSSSCPHPCQAFLSGPLLSRPCSPLSRVGHFRLHALAHLTGQLLGDIPMDWLRGLGFSTCEVCQRVLSLRFNGRCPSCVRPFSAQHGGDSGATRPLAGGAPGVWDVFTSDRRVRSSVPKGAKDAWSRCLMTALADVVAHRDVKSHTDLLTLPALVLPAPSRGGRNMFFVRKVKPTAVVWTQGDYSYPGGCSPSCLCGAAGPPGPSHG